MFARAAHRLFSLALCVLALSCAPTAEPVTAPPPVEVFTPIRLTPAALTPATLPGYVGVQVGDNRLVFEWNGPTPLFVGAVVAGSDASGRGYFGEIVSLRSLDERTTEAVTRPAKLTDFLQSGHLIVRFAERPVREGTAVSPVLEPELSFGGVSCDGGSTSEGPQVTPFVRPTIRTGDFELRISRRGVAECALATGVPLSRVVGLGCDGIVDRFVLRLDATVAAGLRWSTLREREVNCSVDVDLPSALIATVPVAPGVAITLHLAPVVSSEFRYHSTFSATVEVGTTMSLQGALRYQRGEGWAHSFGRPTFEPIASTSGQASITGMTSNDVGLKFSARVDGIAGPYVQLTGGVDTRWSTDLIACTQNAQVGAHIGYEFGAETAEFFGIGASLVLDDETFPIATISRTERLAICSGAPDAASTVDAVVVDVPSTPDSSIDAGVIDTGVIDARADVAVDIAPPRDVTVTDAGVDTAIVDTAVADVFVPECTASESRACGSCGRQTRSCDGGRWSAWSTCAGEGACAPGARQTCAGSGATVVCDSACAWPTCPGYCGDRVCGSGENCATCASDCGCTVGVCDRGACVSCGGIDQACCASASCTAASSVCFAGTCRHCGASAEPCCAGGSCATGTACDASTGTCQPVASPELWSTTFEGLSIPRASGGRRLSNGIEIGDSGAPSLGSGGDVGYPSSGQALAFYGAGAYQPYGTAWMSLPVALSTTRDATLRLWVRSPVDGPGDPRLWVQRGTCGARAFTVRRLYGWQELTVDLAPCPDGTGIVIFLGELFEFSSASPALWVDNISVAYR